MRSVLLSTVAALGLLAGVNLAAAQNATDSRKEPAQEQKAPRVQGEEKVTPGIRKSTDEKGAQDKSKAAQEKPQPAKEKAAQELDKKVQPADGKAAKEKALPAKEKAAQEQAKPVENKAATDKAAQDKAKPAADKAPEKSVGQAKPVENKAVPDKAAQDKPAQDKAQDKAAQDKAAQDKAAQDKSNSPKTATTPGSDKTTTTSAAVVAPEKQAKISEVLAKEKAETNVNFSISIGTSVPEHVRARRLPDEIVVIMPEYRGYDYIIVEDEIVIIEPRTRRIVTTMPRHGGRTAGVSTTMRISLSPEQRRMLREIVLRENVRPVDAKMEIIVGRDLPRAVEVHKFSDQVYSEIPELRSYEFFVRESEVVLVRDKKIVEIID
jgi:Protein of unknown function (DUF1236)